MDDALLQEGTSKNVFTPAERIAELNDIDKSVASLLSSASQAIQILANNTESANTSATLESQKEAFTHHSSEYFSTLSSIEVRLRRQIYALEEAGLIPEGDDSDAKRGRTAGGDAPGANAGGPLDVSWLNARAKDRVGMKMEQELWAQVAAVVKKLEADNMRVEAQADEGLNEVDMTDGPASSLQSEKP